ncbi:SRB4 [Candida theae]|uniref:Mediator of RNA polymerase II transcription subunit 17 n=1 Tax=Candida theae TaxID=1198502 RepID=A0AAD5G0S2_9ASCO|nr:SRB4 [Candida theae]KAI5967453.1 SRB4 [Candida theae]
MFSRDDFTLQELLPRILHERKQFVDITEKGLIEEIVSLNSSKTVSETHNQIAQGNAITPEIPNATEEEVMQEKFNIQKLDLTKNINNALNETSLSLDFVSLLVASVKPNIAKNTMSPHLQKLVKPYSLNSDKLANEEKETLQKDVAKSTKIGLGWKTEATSKITELFRQSSENLTTQVKKEHKYWNMISLVWSNGEALFRMRDPSNNARAIGVKYGYGDSGSDFQDKGLALFRKNVQTGEVSFHPLSTVGNKLVAKTYRYIRVRVLSKIEDSDYMVTGQSIFDHKYKKSPHDIINDIEMARFFLFEEDLFYQLSREAAILLSYSVSVTTNKVSIETGNEIIEIESVPYDNDEEGLENSYQNVSSISSINNEKCQLILIYMKLMLCCFYKYNLKLKQKVPTALTKWKQNNSHPLVLRPLLGNIYHNKYLSEVNEVIINLAQKYTLNNEIKLDKYADSNGKSSNPFKRSIEIPNSTFTWTVQNESGNVLNISINVTSNEVFVDLVTKLAVTKFDSIENYKSNMDGVNVLQNDYYDVGDLNESLEWLIRDF